MPSAAFRGTLSIPPLFALQSPTRSLLHRLNNGLTLILLPTPLAPVVAIQAWVSVGSADESSQQAGLSHVMEHMMFKGTERRGVGDVARDIESAGGEINAWTSRDNTVFHVVMPSRYSDVGIDVLSDVLVNSRFDAAELTREQEVILEEIRQGKDEPLRMLAQTMFSGSFQRHPYRNPVIGSEESVSKFRASDLTRFRDRWYRGSNISLVVAGDFEAQDMKARLERSFSGISDGNPPRRRRSKENSSQSKAAQLQTADVSQSQLALAFRMPPVYAPVCAAMDLLTVVLGQGESSILASSMVRERELCKSAYSYIHALQDHSLAIVGAVTEPEKLSSALPILGGKLQALRDQPVTREELAKAKNAIFADTIYQHETAEGTAHIAGSYLNLAGDADYEQVYLKRIAAIGVDELRAVAHEFFDPKRMNLSVLVPQSQSLSNAQGRKRAANAMLAAVASGMKSATRRTPKATQKTKSPKIPGHSAKPILEHTLKNGMKVLIQRDPSVSVVAARAVWSGGQLLETDTTSGITELMASVLTRGCGRRSAEEIIEDVDDRAATLGGFAGRNSFGLRAEWLAQNWQQELDLFSECLLAPTFGESEFTRAQKRQLSRLVVQADSPSHRAFRLFHEALFRKHGYRRNASGTKQSLQGLTSSAVRKYYKKHYPISELTLAVVGDVDPDKLLARIKTRFGSEPRTSRPARKVVSEKFSGRSENSRQVFETMQREQSHLVVGFPGISIHDTDRYALEVLTTVLGGQGGRMFLELRDRQSLAYQIGAFSLEGLDPGYVAVYLACSPEKVEAAIAAVRSEIDAIKSAPISREELHRSQRSLVGTHEISLQRRASIASSLAFHHAYGLPYDEHLQYAARIQAVRAADVQAVAKRIFDWNQSITVTVMPPSASPAAEKRIHGVVKKTKRSKRRKK